jgi:hypothetical protein
VHVDLHSFEEFKGKGDSLLGANGISWARSTPLGDYLLGIYNRIFWNLLDKKSQKIFKIIITLLCYDLHKTLAKNMSFSKKFKSFYNFFYYLKTLVTMFSKIHWVFFIH